ncbi:MAG: glutaredoxin domain-containing protein [Bacillota bacterium]|uniref:glutaredoxin domain-containing protein n=1 Tax=Virgibacillus salarius TaxID=447199 RepID=UPI0031DE336D
MEESDVLVYISSDCKECENLLKHLKEWDISFRTKNVNENSNYMKELQEKGIYGTPATFIKEESEPILGFQKNKIKYRLGLENKGISHYSSLFEGYRK